MVYLVDYLVDYIYIYMYTGWWFQPLWNNDNNDNNDNDENNNDNDHDNTIMIIMFITVTLTKWTCFRIPTCHLQDDCHRDQYHHYMTITVWWFQPL